MANDTDNSTATRHPEYDAARSLWDQMRVTSMGEHAVKSAGTTYLPKTSGQDTDKVSGATHYTAYKTRAVFYEYLKDTQRAMIGMLTREPTAFVVPKKLESYLLNASNGGETVQNLERRIYDEQLIPSRLGLLLDVTEDRGTETMPVSVLYSAERILNWDDENVPPRWVLLDESRTEMKPGSLQRVEKVEYLLLALNANNEYYTYRFKQWVDGFDMSDPGDEATEDERGELGSVTYPRILNKTLDVIPFTFINAASITPDVELPAMLPLSNLSLAVYRGESDYRQTLFMQGQETLFLKGFSEDELGNIRMGASSYLGTNNNDADASFIGISAEGLTESRESQESLKRECKNLGVELIENGAESGTALGTRLTIRTASLSDIARVAAAGIQQQLTYAAQWLGLSDADIGEIAVTASTDFTASITTPKEMLELWSVVQQGGMTLEDYHEWLSTNDFTEMQLQDWLDRVQNTGTLAIGNIDDGDDDE